MVTAMIFVGKNYELWEGAATTALKAKNKLDFINGTLERPESKDNEEFSEYNAWDMANYMLCSWLLNVIDLKLRMMIPYCNTAKGMWDDSRKRYGMANTPKIHQLTVNLANCKEGDKDVGELYFKLITCGMIEQSRENSSMNVQGLQMQSGKQDYGHVCRILAMDPLPPLDRISNLTQQEENHKKIIIGQDRCGDSAMAFMVRECSKGDWKKELAKFAAGMVMRRSFAMK